VSREGVGGDDVVDGLLVLVAQVAFVARIKPVVVPTVCGPVPLPNDEPQEDPDAKRRLGLPDPSASVDRVRR